MCIRDSLTTALTKVPDQLTNLADWLDEVHPSLQNAVRLRIEGERIGLPGPALTPYLVGLLVMLGMLGTFLGMVVTPVSYTHLDVYKRQPLVFFYIIG